MSAQARDEERLVQEPLRFGPISNSLHPEASPPDRLRRMSNASVLRGVVEGGPRYGDVWARTSAHASDVGWGMFYARFADRAEMLAVVQHNGDAAARLYSINPTTGVWTAVAVNGSDALDASRWQFVQFDEYVYALNETDGLWRRRVGGAGDDANDAWRESLLQYEVDKAPDASAELERPDYPLLSAPASTTATWTIEGSVFSYIPTIDDRLIADGAVDLGATLGASPGSSNLFAMVAITLPAAQDFSKVDWVSWEMTGDAASLQRFAWTALGAWALEATPAPTIDAAKALFAGVSPITQVLMDNTGQRLRVTTNIFGSDRDAVRVLVLALPFLSSGNINVTLSDIRMGGRKMMDVSAEYPQVEYAVAYFNSSTEDLSEPARIGITAALLDGEAVEPGTQTKGAVVKLSAAENVGLLSAGYDKVRFYRLENHPVDRTPTRSWHYLGQVNHGSTNEWLDAVLESDLPGLPVVELDFTAFLEEVSPTAIGVWKQHLLVGGSRWLYMSYAGQPLRVLPSPERLVYTPSASDLAAGRTLAPNDGRRSETVAFATQDNLMICSERGVYVMIGDRAADAFPPRALPVSRAPLTVRAVMAWRGGAALADEDGLWWFAATRGFSGIDDETYRADELTQDVRESWKDLIAGAGGKVVLASLEDELWAFGGTRYMRLTRPDLRGVRHWEEGTWPAVECAVDDPDIGLRVMLANGKIVRAVKDASGAAYEDDNGTPVEWSVTWPMVVAIRRRVTRIRAVGAGAVGLTLAWRDGRFDDGSEALSRAEGEEWVLPVAVPPASGYQLSVSGTVGEDNLTGLLVLTEKAEGYTQ